ncbi:hypothetical protein V5799_016025 [Amblyomma americanum]|uniref:Carboxylic ester hydrolase n=1 Tax=Amblyomma americanum TaxID=6943 RepID=A0AAQ4F670_AMBAM
MPGMNRYLLVLALAVSTFCAVANDIPTVRIDAGVVVGTRVDAGGTQVDAFLGIPYGKPPVGKLRFQRPQPVQPWEGAYNATAKPRACWQLPFDLLGPLALHYSDASEDCLYVNVWRPVGSQGCASGQQSACRGALLPTAVFIHGGAFQWGDSALFVYDAANFVALTGDVVFVTFNYRVSMFGFLDAHGPNETGGNMGLWDQNLALKWVRNNVASFGGDPERVTLWGHSAGAMSVALHALSPHSNGLFHRAIMMSGAPFTMILNRVFNPRASFDSIAAALQCYDARKGSARDQLSEVMTCLRRTEASKAFEALESTRFLQQWFLPVDNDDFFPHTFMSEKTWDKFPLLDVLIGTTINEGTMFYNLLLKAFPGLSAAEPEEYRLIGTAALSRMFEMPISKARQLADIYYGEDDAARTYDQARDITSTIMGDVFFDCPTQLFADAVASKGVRVHRYSFAHMSSHSFVPPWMGVAHSADLLYTLGSLPFLKDTERYTDPLGKVGKRFLQTQDYTSDEDGFMKELVSAFAQFMRNG